MNKYVVVVLLVVVSVLSGLSQASITNGDFSAVDGGGQFILDPWTASPGDLVSNEGGYALFRENYDTDSDRFSSLTQTFDSLGGEQTISFDYQMFSSPVIIGEPTTDVFTAYLNGVGIFSVNNDMFPLPVGTFSNNFQLFTGDNVLRFELFSDDDNYTTTVTLDNVVLTEVSTPMVPVPSAMLLGGIGVASVNWLRRRRIL